MIPRLMLKPLWNMDSAEFASKQKNRPIKNLSALAFLLNERIHPCINPYQDRNCYSGEQTHPKPSAWGRSVENSYKQGDDIKKNQQDCANDCDNLLGRNFLFWIYRWFFCLVTHICSLSSCKVFLWLTEYAIMIACFGLTVKSGKWIK